MVLGIRKFIEDTATVIGTPGARVVQAVVPALRPQPPAPQPPPPPVEHSFSADFVQRRFDRGETAEQIEAEIRGIAAQTAETYGREVVIRVDDPPPPPRAPPPPPPPAPRAPSPTTQASPANGSTTSSPAAPPPPPGSATTLPSTRTSTSTSRSNGSDQDLEDDDGWPLGILTGGAIAIGVLLWRSRQR